MCVLIKSIASVFMNLLFRLCFCEMYLSGIAHAKLFALKAKGLPRISLALYRAMNTSANNAMATLSLTLFEACKNNHINIVKGNCFFLMSQLLFYFKYTYYMQISVSSYFSSVALHNAKGQCAAASVFHYIL